MISLEGESGGDRSGGGSCYKSPKEGHMARDCPTGGGACHMARHFPYTEGGSGGGGNDCRCTNEVLDEYGVYGYLKFRN